MVTIYLDILIVLNIYVNFFLLKATARFIHVPLKLWRYIVASVTGSFFSLTILLPSGGFIITLMIKLIAAAVIIGICFGIREKRFFLRLLLYFYIINFIFAGIVGFLHMTLKPSFMAFNNSYFYVDFSLISLVIFTAAAYLAVTVTRRIMDKNSQISKKYSVFLKLKGEVIKLNGLADTGNSLTDSFTGKPVIICSQKDIGITADLSVLSAQELYNEYRFRLTPYSTIGNNGLIPVFSPDEVVIVDEEEKKSFKIDVIVGIIPRETSVIFNPKILL